MSAYAAEIHRCQLALILRAVLAAGGNQCRAAEAIGLHRNTVSRALRDAGYTSEQLRRMAIVRIAEGLRKPPASESAPHAEVRRVA